ncbi:glutamine--tRNA ligase/YqeY domain fusion protein [Marinilongibacter aquaticus]|uniref:glutamine--tRNA ligase/YqeY domain fusion protein n=1 Tax=Marinilongibacter aquaticus TaxID=2975157 RepID=UPI0021BD05DE|nr:glutamine--tRNA ligase/YqeY domain fusion protein [Marinilongibacter aquaticus]UBM60392.1 glutamine--tRNA ligase/YqeY domain fusion protein [Marinilongibacter aquaticus]
MSVKESKEKEKSLHFIEEIIEADLASGKHKSILTRFPPEPNGYLHIGHAKSICLNFGMAEKYGGETNLRFDDTNPVNEDTEYVDSIKADVHWLGYNWKEELYASDYFETLYDYAEKLIQKGLAYVDDSKSEEIAELKGTPTEPGKNSPYRDRTPEENLQLFREMRAGQHPEGSKVLRAKIDMSSPNMLMRDPVIYRIKFAHHHRTGDKWCIYPLYDFAHGQSDSIEHITHSVCTLEFVPHREVYDWLIDKLEIFPSKQYEFARLNLTYTVMSKRKLKLLVEKGFVNGWDDPRMPTISGLRRRGYTPKSIRDFCDRIGVAKRDNLIDVSLLEFFIRDHLNKIANRVMVVNDPLKVTITNIPEGEVEDCIVENNPEDPESGSRIVPFSREIFIEKDDFLEDAPKKYFRLKPGGVVRLKGAYIIECDEVVKDEQGEIIELKCHFIENSKSGQDTSGVRTKGVIHWVSQQHYVPVELRVYDRLFREPDVNAYEGDFLDLLNDDSLQIINAYAEPSLREATLDDKFQFMRQGYYVLDKESQPEKLIFNKTVGLRDSWKK